MTRNMLAVLILMLIVVLSVASMALGSNQATFKIGNGTYNINGLVKEDVAPYIDNGRTYLPLRYVAYALGIGDNSIDWDNHTQTAYLQRNGELMAIRVGDNTITTLFNGQQNKTIKIDAPAQMRQDRVMLPLRAVGEGFGVKVDWNEQERTVTIIE